MGMKVLVLATKYFGLGGAEAYTRMFAEAIAAHGAQVDVLSLLDGDAADRNCPGRYLGDQGAASTRMAQAQFVAQAVRHGLRYDLIVCGHVALAPVAHTLFRLRRRPYLVIGYGIDVWGELGPRRRAALQRAARIVALSRFTARQVAAVHGVPDARIGVIHPAVDPVLLDAARAETTPTGPRDPVILLTVARLSAQEQYKGCDTVISVLPSIISEVKAHGGPTVEYVVAGDGDDLPRLRALADRHRVAASVSFVGQAQRSDLPMLYRDSDIYVMPSVTEQRANGWAGEGFGITYIEAAAFGRPVITGSGGGAPEAVRDRATGYVVDGRNPTALMVTIARLASDYELRVRLGRAGRQWVEQYFTFERFVKDVGAAADTAMRGNGAEAQSKAKA
jgi:phosphatidyl-myo-inositol dimannoside synthase